MKGKSNFVYLAGVLALLCNVSALAQDREVIHPAAKAEQMINESGVRDQVINYEMTLARKGFLARKEASFAGEKTAVDDAGRVIRSKLVLIPFSGPSGKVEATILVTSRESEDGDINQSFVFYSVGDPACDCQVVSPDHSTDKLPPEVGTTSSTDPVSARNGILVASPWTSFPQLVNLIKSGNWWGVRNWIYGKLASGIADNILAEVVRAAFESSGYYCPTPAWWVPYKSVWYLVTCARMAQ